MIRMSKTTQYCANCGKQGHLYRKCLSPVLSMGVILFKKIDSEIKYLMVQRKDTLGFVEFMRGKYNLENLRYLYKLFKIMTKKERDGIVSSDFDTLWDNLWMKKQTSQYHNEYDSSKKKFNILKKGIKVKSEKITLETINNLVPINWYEPEWGFPKGRRNVRESDRDCALREFMEETGLKKHDYHVRDELGVFNELFSGTNNIRYKHIYYIAEANPEFCADKFEIDVNNFSQVSEISNINWWNFTEALKKIRSYNNEKKKYWKNFTILC